MMPRSRRNNRKIKVGSIVSCPMLGLRIGLVLGFTRKDGYCPCRDLVQQALAALYFGTTTNARFCGRGTLIDLYWFEKKEVGYEWESYLDVIC